ncbi:MAG: nitroreductase family protein [Candidatus Odinarchaeota archaeon]
MKEAILKRRAYRSFDAIDITDEIIDELAEAVRLAPSCMNNQPWRYVFARGEAIKRVYGSLTRGNQAWAAEASLIIAVTSKQDSDCVIKNRIYYLFDTGMATAFLILRATELGLVAHPIAGYDEQKAKEALEIPDDMTVITLVIVGKKSTAMNPNLSDKQVESEKTRPARLPKESIVFIDRYSG